MNASLDGGHDSAKDNCFSNRDGGVRANLVPDLNDEVLTLVMHLDAENEMMLRCVALEKFIVGHELTIQYLVLENIAHMLMVADVQEIINKHKPHVTISLTDPDNSIKSSTVLPDRVVDKRAEVGISFGAYMRILSSDCSVTELEKGLQLVYQIFTTVVTLEGELYMDSYFSKNYSWQEKLSYDYSSTFMITKEQLRENVGAGRELLKDMCEKENCWSKLEVQVHKMQWQLSWDGRGEFWKNMFCVFKFSVEVLNDIAEGVLSRWSYCKQSQRVDTTSFG